MTASVNGRNFRATDAWFTNWGEGDLIVVARADDGTIVTIIFKAPTLVPATLTIESLETAAGQRTMAVASVTINQIEYESVDGGGRLTVTALTGTNCQGTFSFKAKNVDGTVANVTNGAFNVPLE